MSNFRDENGFIKIDKILDKKIGCSLDKFSFMLDGKKYYYKKILDKKIVYNELIAYEISKDYGIPCVDYDLASFNGLYGVFSEDFIGDSKFISMKGILSEYYDDLKIESNNLTDIISALEFRYKNPIIVGKLMNDIVNIFIFDVLIANVDRHYDNYGILEDKTGIRIAPIFDNTFMLSDLTLLDGGYSLGVDGDDNFLSDDYFDFGDKYLIKFLKYSSSEYVDYLKSKLWIIESENVDRILSRVENKIHTKIDENIKKGIKVKFKINLDNINCALEYCNERKL